MNITEMQSAIGKKGNIREGQLVFTVEIKDAKNAYGNLRYLVTPLNGYGQTWVNADRVRVLEATQ